MKITTIITLGKTKANGDRAIYLRVRYEGGKKDIPLNLFCKKWDKSTDRVLKSVVEDRMYNVRQLIYQLEKEGHSIDWLFQKLGTAATSSFYDAGMDHVEKLISLGKIGNASAYKTSIDQVSKIYPNVTISGLTKEKVVSFIEHKKITVVNNTIRRHVKILSSLYNIFIKAGKAQSNPFKADGLMPPYTITRKRNIKIDVINKVYSLNKKATDLFYLCFLLRGMDFYDLAHLTQANIQGEYLYYYRGKLEDKTLQIQVKLIPKALHIIDRYKGDIYLLDIISMGANSNPKAYSKYRVALKNVNEGLGVATEDVGYKISTKFARHSFATIGKQLGYSKDLIGEMLGHSGRTITDVYLDMFDQHIVDDAHLNIVGQG
jgi:hypothetical protein